MMSEKTVLVVEDEVLVGMMLARKIGENGYRVCGVVTTGEEVLAAALKHRPGAILMDISLGGEINGIEAARRLRKELAVPVIFFTGYNRDQEMLARAAEVGALAVLDKLGPVEEMMVALNRAFSPASS